MLRSQEIMNWRIPWFLQQGILEGKFGSFHRLPYLFWPFTFFVCLLLEMVIWELWCYREKCDNSLHLFIDFYFQDIDSNFFFIILGQQKEIWYLLPSCTYCIVYYPSQLLSLEQRTRKLERWLRLKVLNCSTFSASIRNLSVRWDSALALTTGNSITLLCKKLKKEHIYVLLFLF